MIELTSFTLTKQNLTAKFERSLGYIMIY